MLIPKLSELTKIIGLFGSDVLRKNPGKSPEFPCNTPVFAVPVAILGCVGPTANFDTIVRGDER